MIEARECLKCGTKHFSTQPCPLQLRVITKERLEPAVGSLEPLPAPNRHDIHEILKKHTPDDIADAIEFRHRVLKQGAKRTRNYRDNLRKSGA